MSSSPKIMPSDALHCKQITRTRVEGPNALGVPSHILSRLATRSAPGIDQRVRSADRCHDCPRGHRTAAQPRGQPRRPPRPPPESVRHVQREAASRPTHPRRPAETTADIGHPTRSLNAVRRTVRRGGCSQSVKCKVRSKLNGRRSWPSRGVPHLQQTHGEHHPKVRTRGPLQRTGPGALTGQRPVESLGTLDLGRGEWPSHVFHRPEATAVEGFLDRADGPGVLGSEEMLPSRRQLALPGRARYDVCEIECGQDGGEDALQNLQNDRADEFEQDVGGMGPAYKIGNSENITRCEEREEDREKGEGRRQRERQHDACDMLIDGDCH